MKALYSPFSKQFFSKKHGWIQIISWIIAAFIAFAAFAKFFSPSPLLRTFDQWVGVFEVLLIIFLIVLAQEWRMWLLLSLVFAAWMGYSLFWYYVELPCGCLGSLVTLPTGYSIAFDLFFLSTALIIALLLKAPLKWLYITLLSTFLALLIGFSLAQWIYETLILTV